MLKQQRQAMKSECFQCTYEVYETESELSSADAALLRAARNATSDAYAPYSNFFVGAAAMLANGQLVTGSNQENASFPAGICAERVLLSAVASLYPRVNVRAMAVSYNNLNGGSAHPITPCGLPPKPCRARGQRKTAIAPYIGGAFWPGLCCSINGTVIALGL